VIPNSAQTSLSAFDNAEFVISIYAVVLLRVTYNAIRKVPADFLDGTHPSISPSTPGQTLVINIGGQNKRWRSQGPLDWWGKKVIVAWSICLHSFDPFHSRSLGRTSFRVARRKTAARGGWAGRQATSGAALRAENGLRSMLQVVYMQGLARAINLRLQTILSRKMAVIKIWD
jgi:hypothetical protein